MTDMIPGKIPGNVMCMTDHILSCDRRKKETGTLLKFGFSYNIL